MSQVPNKYNIPVAVKGHSEQDLTSHVVMSHDFGVLNPIMCRAMFPDDKFQVKPEYFTYLDPLPCPTFGAVKMITRGFFVPFRILVSDWKEFISNNKVPRSTLTSVPSAIPFTCVSEFTKSLFQNITVSNNLIVPNGTRKDIVVYELSRSGSAGNYIYSYTSRDVQLSYMGRQYLSVLRGLGYNFPFVIAPTTWTSAEVIDNDEEEIINLWNYATQKLSLLPWIAFWRFYIDWIVPSRFVSSLRNVILGLDVFKNSNTSHGISYFSSPLYGLEGGSRQFANSVFLSLFTTLPSVYLPDDFFTTAFKNQYGSEDGANMAYDVSLKSSEVSDKFYQVQTGPNVGAVAEPEADGSLRFNMFTIRTLGALQDMMNRGKVAGSKIQDYLKATYGIEPGSSALDISTYLGSHSDDIKIGSVSSNADTFVETTGDGAYLGQYAGRGLGGSPSIGEFSYEAKEHGLFFITCELVAKSSYWQGLRPECTMLDRLDFFQPELDSNGVVSIPQYLLNNGISLKSDDCEIQYIDPRSTFGYTSNYSKYKVAFDSLLGDFRVGGLNTGMDSWYLARYFTDSQFINENFSKMVQDNTSREYDKIFQNADNSADHFKTNWILHVKAHRPMKSLEEVLEFEDKEGKRVSSSFNGSVNS